MYIDPYLEVFSLHKESVCNICDLRDQLWNLTKPIINDIFVDTVF